MMETSQRSAYENGILRQPDTLQAVVDAGIEPSTVLFLASVRDRFDRIVMTGMGSGPWASYPASLRLLQADIDVHVVETAELISYTPRLLRPGTLLWITSQSGESAEIVALLDALPSPAPTVLAVVNNLASPLASRADVVIPLHVGIADDGVAGTGTFANSIVVNALATDVILGRARDAELARAPQEVAAFLDGWDARVEEGIALATASDRIAVLGRGSSLAAVRTGALLIKEAGKRHAEAMAASEFRHGPIELVDQRFLAIIAEGDQRTASLNRRLANDVIGWGGQVAWIGTDGRADGAPVGTVLPSPRLSGEAAAIGELLPLQVMSVATARAQGMEPGVFKNARRVTRTL